MLGVRIHFFAGIPAFQSLPVDLLFFLLHILGSAEHLLTELHIYSNFYTTLSNFSTKYSVMCKVYTDVGGIKQLYHACPPVRKIIHSLMLVDYLKVQADNLWYN